jgi:TolA-binding protein
MQKQRFVLGLMLGGLGLLIPARSGVLAQAPPEAAAALAAAAPETVEPLLAAVPAAEPTAWLATDQADSLYREARAALNRGDYRAAARLFRDLRRRYPDSGYVPDAYYWEAFALYRDGSSDNLRRAVEVLDEQGERYPDARTRRDAEELAVRVQGALARRGDAAAAELVVGIAVEPAPPAPPAEGEPVAPEAPGGIAAQEDQDEDIRAAALNALLQMDAERALPILKQVLARRDVTSVELRRKAVFLVAQQFGDETAGILLDAARNDPDAEVRANAVFWLSQVPTEEAVNALDSILQFSTDREIQEKAVFALSQHDSEAAARALRNYVRRRDVPEDLKHNAIFWLGQSYSEENQAFLRELYATLESQDLKERVIFSISQSPSGENQRWLMDLALDPGESIEMRKKALFWAGQSGQVPVADLAQLYDSMEDMEMREQLIFTLSQRHEPQAVDKLMFIARNDPNPEFRRKAIFWLGQSEDPRVAEFLLEIINQEQ